MADQAHSTATLRLTLGDLRIAHPVTVPSGRVAAVEVVPALQGLVNAVVAAAEAGQAISCRKGCGACCRQLVPVSRTEGERLLEVVASLPPARRAVLTERFAAAEARIVGAGLAERDGRSDRELSSAYFGLGVPCPFLEDEACSIHPERPLVCREYLVTSPAALCAGPSHDAVRPAAIPKMSVGARSLQDDGDGWFPLALLMRWARTRPRTGTRRTGPEWVQRYLSKLLSVAK